LHRPRPAQKKWRWSLILGLLGACCAAAALALPEAAPADPVRSTTSPQYFKSGSERSLPVLLEIRDSLKRIDSRLQRIEQAVLTAANQRSEAQPARPERTKETPW
jgi:hypothetical protein